MSIRSGVFMFENSGKKLRTFAGILFSFSILCSFFSFIISVNKKHCLSLALIPVSLFVSYIICFSIYVFGYLREYFGIVDRNMRKIASADTNKFPNLEKSGYEEDISEANNN